jgi:hypothetical protein
MQKAWNLIIRTLKNPDVTAVHTAENSRTFIVTITPPTKNHAGLDRYEVQRAVERYCTQFEGGYKVEVQGIA